MWVLGQPFVIPSSTLSLFLLLGVGLFSLFAQVFQTLGLQRESAGRAATMSYLQIIFALAGSWRRIACESHERVIQRKSNELMVLYIA